MIIKPSDRAEKPSVEKLKEDFEKSTDEIRRLLGSKQNDRRDGELTGKIRASYIKAARLARLISEISKDKEEVKQYQNNYLKLSNTAASYGSVLQGKVPNTTFDDVKGLDEVKRLIKSFIFMINKPHLVKYYKLDGGLGLLLYGAPGTGKTMFAEAIAHEMGLPLFIVTPADIHKSYVGESEQAVKQIFLEIDECEDGAILFVDECESIFSRRDKDTKDYKSAVTTELLQRMNGFGVNGAKRIMVAATNRPDEIDPAYLRYKRFSHIVNIPPPDTEAKKAIIAGKLKGIALEDGLTIDDVVNMTETATCRSTPLGEIESVDYYYSAADICGIVEEAARIALEQLEKTGTENPIPLTRAMFDKAFKRVQPGISKKDLEFYDTFRKMRED